MGRSGAFDVVVIGAGVIGASVAYHCAEVGLATCLVEREGLGGRTTGASAGLTLVSPRTPGPALEFSRANIERLGELRDRFGEEIDFVQCGGLMVAEDEVERELLREFVRRQSARLPVAWLEPAELRRLEPHLSHHILGAAHCPLDGYASPMGLSLALARHARALGADLRVRTEVTGLLRAGDRVVGIRTSHGDVAAGRVVNAAGVWSPEIARAAGVEVPVVPRKGQLLVSEPVSQLFRNVLSHAGIVDFRAHGIPTPAGVVDETHKKRYMKQAAGGPFGGRVYIGSTSEFVGFDRNNTWTAVVDLARYAVETIPALREVRLVRSWAGLRPRSGDGKFLIGPAPGVEGLFLATGHDSNGVLHSSLTGKLLAEWFVSGERPPLLAQFDPARLVAAPAAVARA
jgi:sarcosine oxidase subunit beta